MASHLDSGCFLISRVQWSPASYFTGIDNPGCHNIRLQLKELYIDLKIK